MSLAALHHSGLFSQNILYFMFLSTRTKKSQASTPTCCLNHDSMPPAVQIKWADKKKKKNHTKHISWEKLPAANLSRGFDYPLRFLPFPIITIITVITE